MNLGNGGGPEDSTTSVGRATSQWVAFNIEKRKMARIPVSVIEEFKYQALEDSPVMGPDYAVVKLPDVRDVVGDDSTPGVTHTARLSDVDMNGHVNNVVYAEWLLDSVPTDMWAGHELREMELEFRSECNCGDVVDSVTCREDEVAAAAAEGGDDVVAAAEEDDGEVRLVHMLLKRGLGKKEAEVIRARTVWEPKKGAAAARANEEDVVVVEESSKEEKKEKNGASSGGPEVASDGTVTFNF